MTIANIWVFNKKGGCLATYTTRKPTSRLVIGCRRAEVKAGASQCALCWLAARGPFLSADWLGRRREGRRRWGAAGAGPWGARGKRRRRLRLAGHTEEAKAQVLLCGLGWGGPTASWALGRQSGSARVEMSLGERLVVTPRRGPAVSRGLPLPQGKFVFV